MNPKNRKTLELFVSQHKELDNWDRDWGDYDWAYDDDTPEDDDTPDFAEDARLVHKETPFIDRVRERMTRLPDISAVERARVAGIAEGLFADAV